MPTRFASERTHARCRSMCRFRGGCQLQTSDVNEDEQIQLTNTTEIRGYVIQFTLCDANQIIFDEGLVI